MGKIALMTTVLLLGWVVISDAQTAVSAVETQSPQANSGAPDNAIAKSSSLSLNTNPYDGVKTVNGQSNFLRLDWNNRKEDRKSPYKSYNPMSIPLW